MSIIKVEELNLALQRNQNFVAKYLVERRDEVCCILVIRFLRDSRFLNAHLSTTLLTLESTRRGWSSWNLALMTREMHCPCQDPG